MQMQLAGRPGQAQPTQNPTHHGAPSFRVGHRSVQALQAHAAANSTPLAGVGRPPVGASSQSASAVMPISTQPSRLRQERRILRAADTPNCAATEFIGDARGRLRSAGDRHEGEQRAGSAQDAIHTTGSKYCDVVDAPGRTQSVLNLSASWNSNSSGRS